MARRAPPASLAAARLFALACCLARPPCADARSLRLRRDRPSSIAAIAESVRTAFQRRNSTDVYYVTNLLDKLKVFAHDADADSEFRYREEHDRLSAALQLAKPGSPDRESLEMALKYADEDRLERRVALTEMLEYYYTSKAMLGSASSAPDCRFLACGAHATCQQLQGRIGCECDECYEGDGFTCRPVPCTPKTLGSASPVRGPTPPGFPVIRRQAPEQAAELQLAIFGQDQIAIVVRDAAAGNRGALVVGRLRGMSVDFGFRQDLSLMPAYGVRLAGLPNGRLVIVFRDQLTDGTGYIMGAEVNKTSPLQAMMSAPVPFAKGQAERAALVALSASKVVCLFAEHIGKPDAAERAWGSAALVEVKAGGIAHVHGKYHFSQGFELSRFSAVALSPSTMIASFRALPLPSQPPGEPSRELCAVWIGLDGDELLVDPHPIGIEPERRHMLARDVSLVSENTFAYAYESGLDKTTKMAIIQVDPASHRMSILSGPQVLAKGSVRFLSSLSLPTDGESPMTFTMFQRPQESCMAETCRISPKGRIADCKDIAWSDHELLDVSAGRLTDGRAVFAFVTTSGTLLYQLLTPKEIGAIP